MTKISYDYSASYRGLEHSLAYYGALNTDYVSPADIPYNPLTYRLVQILDDPDIDGNQSSTFEAKYYGAFHGDPVDAYLPSPGRIYALDETNPIGFRLPATAPAFPDVRNFVKTSYEFNDSNLFADYGRFIDAAKKWYEDVDKLSVTQATFGDLGGDVGFIVSDTPLTLGVIRTDILDYDSNVIGSLFDDVIISGAGNDTLYGGDLNPAGVDKLDGGDGDDALIGGPGKDNLSGGAGNDTFDYQKYDFAGVTAGTKQTLDGGANDGNVAGVNKGIDLLKLPGSAADYDFNVAFTANAWLSTTTSVVTRAGNASGFVNLALETKDIEKAVFENQISNAVTLTASSVRVEMLRLAKEVYGPEPTFSDKAEPLAYQPAHAARLSENISDAAESRNWRGVSALELGIAPADYSATGTLKYSFVGGHYQAIRTGESFLGDAPEANALALTGLVNGQKTLAISIRGTDQAADFSDYATFQAHYSKFKPLIDALKTYVGEAGVTQVLISGHSLGAGAAQYLLSEFSGATVKMFTDGSPGSEANKSDARVENWINTDDAVPLLGDLTHIPGGVVALAASLASSGMAGILAGAIGVVDSIKALGLLATMQRKDRAGGEIFIDSDVANVYGTAEHDAGLYVQQLVKLLAFAKDAGSPFAMSAKSAALVAALKNDSIYAGPDIRIALGAPVTPGGGGAGGGAQAVDYFAPFRKEVRAYSDDDFVLANNGSNDTILVKGLFTDGGNLISTNLRVVDGGTGDRDVLNLANLSIGSSFFQSTASNGGWALKQKQIDLSSGAVTALFDVATLYRVEFVSYRNTTLKVDGSPVDKVQTPSSPGPTPPNAEAIAAAPPTFILDSSFDYADAGNGSFSVIGTNLSDLLYAGSGSKQVSLGDGDDTFIARLDVTAAAVDQNVVDGGGGNDILIGGSARDLLIGGADEDDLSGDAANDALLGGAGADRMSGGEGNDFAFGGEFNTDGSFKTGSGNDSVNGDAGDDGLWGMDGDDVLDGGEGSDGLVGGAGNDMLTGGASGDFLFGGDFTSAGTFAANSGNDVLSGGEGNDGLWGFDGDDAINGDAGNDVAFGGAGADIIEGGDGNDYLLGEEGDDQVGGGAGFDYLYGGTGADTFVFRKGDSADWILDFKASENDRLRFLHFGFASFASIPLVDLSSPGNPAVQLTFIEGDRVDQLTIFGVTLAQLSAENVFAA